MPECRGTVLLNRVVPDPGKSVAEDESPDKEDRTALGDGSGDADNARGRSRKMKDAISRLRMLAHVEGPKLLEVRERGGFAFHTDILAPAEQQPGKG